eukprot:3403591-Alexandrium_andersonii.AAC.1
MKLARTKKDFGVLAASAPPTTPLPRMREVTATAGSAMIFCTLVNIETECCGGPLDCWLAPSP